MITGIPYAPAKDPKVMMKKAYLDEQIRASHGKSVSVSIGVYGDKCRAVTALQLWVSNAVPNGWSVVWPAGVTRRQSGDRPSNQTSLRLRRYTSTGCEVRSLPVPTSTLVAVLSVCVIVSGSRAHTREKSCLPGSSLKYPSTTRSRASSECSTHSSPPPLAMCSE